MAAAAKAYDLHSNMDRLKPVVQWLRREVNLIYIPIWID